MEEEDAVLSMNRRLLKVMSECVRLNHFPDWVDEERSEKEEEERVRERGAVECRITALSVLCDEMSLNEE